MDNIFLIITFIFGLIVHATVLGLWAGKISSKVKENEKNHDDLEKIVSEKISSVECKGNIKLLREKRKSDERILETIIHNQGKLSEQQEENNLLIGRIGDCLTDIQRNIKCKEVQNV